LSSREGGRDDDLDEGYLGAMIAGSKEKTRRKTKFKSDTLLSRAKKEVRSLTHERPTAFDELSGDEGGSRRESSERSSKGVPDLVSASRSVGSDRFSGSGRLVSDFGAFKFVKFAAPFAPTVVMTGPEFNGVWILELSAWDGMMIQIPRSVRSLRLSGVADFSEVDRWTLMIQDVNRLKEVCVENIKQLEHIRGLTRMNELRYLCVKKRPRSFEQLIQVMQHLSKRSNLKMVSVLFDIEKLSTKKGMLSREYIRELAETGYDMNEVGEDGEKGKRGGRKSRGKRSRKKKAKRKYVRIVQGYTKPSSIPSHLLEFSDFSNSKTKSGK
jgi:hypothetical protein